MPAFGIKMVSNFKTFIVLGVAVFALLAGALMTTTGTVHAEADDDIEVTLIYDLDDDKVDVFVARYGLATEQNGVLIILSAAADGTGNLLNSTVLGGVVVTGCAAAANLAAANCTITSYSTTVSIAADATVVYVDYVLDDFLAAHTVAAAQTLNAIDEDVELNSLNGAAVDVGTASHVTWIDAAGDKGVTVTLLPGSYRARAGEGVRITSKAEDSDGTDFYTAMVDTDPTVLNFNWQSNPGKIVASTSAAGVASYNAPRRDANDTITARVGYDRPASAGDSATVIGTTYFRTIADTVEEVVVEEVVEEPVVGAMTLSVSAQIALALAALTLIGGGTAFLRRSRREN
jgi:hypothetical protein